MLALLRVVAMLVALAAVGFAIAYLRTGDRQYLKHARRTLFGGIAAALAFFAVMFIQRLY
jgi:hypothetical protein